MGVCTLLSVPSSSPQTKLLNAHRKTAVGGNPQYNFLPLSMRLVLDLAKVDRPSRQNMMRRSAVTKESLVRDNKVFLQEGDALKERTGMYDTDIGKMRQLSDVNMVCGTVLRPMMSHPLPRSHRDGTWIR